MEIQVVIEQVLQPESFSKKDGTQMVRNSFVGKTKGQYPKSVKFDVLNAETFTKMQIAIGGEYLVSFDVESREWNGKWFTSLNAWKAVAIQGGSNVGAHPQPQPQMQAQSQIPAAEAVDDSQVPF